MRRRGTHQWTTSEQVQFVFALTALASVISCFAIAALALALR